jgi:ribosome-associated toxin RatA of RatAB toxin-antitoxin module
MAVTTDEIVIDASIAEVWALVIDIEHWPDFVPAVTSLERLDHGPVRIGSQARLRQPGQPRRIWTVTRIEEPHVFVWQTSGLGLRMTGEHHLEPTGPDGRHTRQRLVLALDGPLGQVLGRVAGARLRQALRTENHAFAARATRRGPV